MKILYWMAVAVLTIDCLAILLGCIAGHGREALETFGRTTTAWLALLLISHHVVYGHGRNDP